MEGLHFALKTQKRVSAFMTETAWHLLYASKVGALSKYSSFLCSSSGVVTYCELLSQKDCEVFLMHGEYSGGFFVEDGDLQTVVSPKAFIQYRNSEVRRIGYVEDIVDGFARVNIANHGMVSLEMPSFLNRPYNRLSTSDGDMILLEIVPVRFKFSAKTLKVNAIFHRATCKNGNVVSSQSS